MSTRYLIGTKALMACARDPDLRIIDCRFDLSDPDAGRRSYETAHIPGAQFLDLNTDLASEPVAGSGRHPLPRLADIERRLGQLGIDASSRVVVYDDLNGGMAARAWWVFRWLGLEDVQLLDGGLTAWVENGLPLTAALPDFSPREFSAEAREELLVTSSELFEQLDDIPSLRLIDARDARRFAGEVEPIDAVAGHIPGARNLPFTESLNKQGRWRKPEELEKLWSSTLGDDPEVNWIAMCGSGVTACHLALSAMLAGYREPRLYVGSWSEWISDRERPIGRK